jgi:hypothetical protein
MTTESETKPETKQLSLPGERAGATKTCPCCPPEVGEQSIDNFGISRSRPDGHNLYCKVCVNRKVLEGRLRMRERRDTRRALLSAGSPIQLLPARKPDVRAFTALSPSEKILRALKGNALTQRQILRETRLSREDLGLGLAGLMVERRTVKSRYVESLGQNVYFRRKAQVVPAKREVA